MRIDGPIAIEGIVAALRVPHMLIHKALEEHLAMTWRITKIEERSDSFYRPTLTTRAALAPVYVLAKVIATFDIEATENGPVDEVIGGIVHDVPRSKLYCKAALMADGKLCIVESTIEIPQ